MKFFGFNITRQKGLESLMTTQTSGGWWPVVREAFTGAWQRNIEINLPDVLTSGPVFACVTLIASDIAKMELNLVAKTDDGIWVPTENPAYSPVLRRPNHYQNRITFVLSWLISKLTRGNTYALKARDKSNKVRSLYILDPSRVRVLVAANGDVYYELSQDALSGLREQTVTVPAREIIHDIMIPLYHPLCGVSPIHACGLAAIRGLKIQRNSTTFFTNQSTPSGILSAPGAISEATAKRLEEHWNANYSGEQNAGKIAALGDGLKFEPMTMTARDSQLVDQLQNAAIEVCNAYHVPAFKVGYGDMPSYDNIEALDAQYYSQCLQILIEQMELCLDEGLDLPANIGVEFDLDGLLRMDSATKMTTVVEGMRGGVYKVDEGRRKFNLPPVAGGDTIYLQEQDHSLEWLSRRDQQPLTPPAAPTPPPAVPVDTDGEDPVMDDKAIGDVLRKELGMAA